MTIDNMENTNKLSTSQKIIAGFLWGMSSFLFYGLSKIIPQFQETFDSFGTSLPTLTTLSLSFSPSHKYVAYLCLIPIAFIFGLNEFSFKAQKLYYKITLTMFFLIAAYFLASLVSMYLPIFSLGSVV